VARRKKTEQPEGVLSQNNTPLTQAVLCSDYAAMRQIVAGGADLNEFDDFQSAGVLSCCTMSLQDDSSKSHMPKLQKLGVVVAVALATSSVLIAANEKTTDFDSAGPS